MSSDDPFGGDDWGEAPSPPPSDDNIDMNYGQPLPNPGPQPGQVPGQGPQAGGPQPGGPQPGGPQPGGPQPGGPQGGQFQPPSQPPAPNQQLQTTKPKLENDDIIPIVLTAFFPGLGQLMLGQQMKGIVIFLVSVVTCGMGGLLWIAVILDAYLVAMTRKYRQVDEWEVFPDMNKHFGSG